MAQAVEYGGKSLGRSDFTDGLGTRVFWHDHRFVFSRDRPYRRGSRVTAPPTPDTAPLPKPAGDKGAFTDEAILVPEANQTRLPGFQQMMDKIEAEFRANAQAVGSRAVSSTAELTMPDPDGFTISDAQLIAEFGPQPVG